MGESGSSEIRPPWGRSDRFVPRAVLRPLQEFLDTSTASGVLLLVAVLVALAWANSPWSGAYDALWSTPVVFDAGPISLDLDLRHAVNDGLMALFFLVAGLEIKRELTTGELSGWRSAALPIVAAVGGMVVPALVYLAVVGGGPDARGWGIPMATDIAFALGALALAGSAAAPGLRPLLLTLAIVDDMGAILVIALFYTGGVDAGWLIAAFGMAAIVVLAQLVEVRASVVYVLAGLTLWYAVYRAGVHPTIAGVAMGLLTPSKRFQQPRAVSAEARRTADETMDDPDPPDADAHWWIRLAWLSNEAVSPLARVEHVLLPWASFLILPLFALANAGVEISWAALDGALRSPVALGVAAGLVVGKPVGVWVAGMASVRGGLARMPAGVGPVPFLGLAVAAGIGFTISIFIAELAFGQGPVLEHAKLGILAATIVSGVAANLLLRLRPHHQRGHDGDIVVGA
jgi:NhaA family Na+:H+ antiporter